MPEKAQARETIRGVLERIVFFNEENAYCIAEVSTGSGSSPVTVLGPLPGVQCGETLELHGEWTSHQKHGDQFKVASFTSTLPASVHGIRKYLGSGLVHGIGKSYAKKIVDHFGADTLRVISEDSGRLEEIPGIGRQRAKSIRKAWAEQQTVRDLMVFLQTYGVTPAQCLRLVKRYGENARRVLQDNPYRLAEDIERIGFKTADKLALNIGIPTNSSNRIDAGLLHVIREAEEDGHTAIEADRLTEAAIRLLSVDAGLVQKRKNQLVSEGRIEERRSGVAVCQTPRLGAAEQQIANACARLASAKSGLPKIHTEAAVEWAQKQAGFDFAPQQAGAIRKAVEEKVTLLTGGPGTGKTTILRAVVSILSAKKAKVLLASPTGRAAQRLAEAAGAPASTIHRLLKYDGARRRFSHDEENPLRCDLLVVDEASMLDTSLASSLLRAIPDRAHLLLVGDADQLPSVGPGNVLADLMTALPQSVTRLEHIYRQEADSGIISTAYAILEGRESPAEVVDSLKALNPKADFTFVRAPSPEQAAAGIRYLVREYIPKTLRLDPVEGTQVLAPMHRGTGGISALNLELQSALNASDIAAARLARAGGSRPASQRHFREKTGRRLPHEVVYGATTYRLGDKVIQTRNNYDKNVFNGDIGRISGIAPDGSGITVDFQEESVEFTKGELSELQLAYAISIHKSQGSEYPVVVIPLLKQHFMLLQRNLIYTAVTRAKRKVYMIGDPEAFSMAVRNAKAQVRLTLLKERLSTALTKQDAGEA